jgi:hypothetical protein
MIKEIYADGIADVTRQNVLQTQKNMITDFFSNFRYYWKELRKCLYLKKKDQFWLGIVADGVLSNMTLHYLQEQLPNIQLKS